LEQNVKHFQTLHYWFISLATIALSTQPINDYFVIVYNHNFGLESMVERTMEYPHNVDRRRSRHNDNDDDNDIDHDVTNVVSSPPYKIGKVTTISTPNPQSISSYQHRNNSMSSTDVSVTTSSYTTPAPNVSSTSNTTPLSSSANKAYKGLRHFSLMVCKKVEEKGTTSYNEVADELVRQILEDRNTNQASSDTSTVKSIDRGMTPTAGSSSSTTSKTTHTKFDEKNIRRRVYDALNVLMAMNIISKDKKAIMWKGLPSSLSASISPFTSSTSTTTATPNVESHETIQKENEVRLKRIQKKREMVKELLLQHVCFRNLVERNHQREQQQLKSDTKNPSNVKTLSSSPTSNKQNQSETASATGSVTKNQSSTKLNPKEQKQQLLLDNKIPLPFIVINTSKNAVIQCNMSRDLTDVMFDFTMPFEINDDNSILKLLALYVVRFATKKGQFNGTRTHLAPIQLFPYIRLVLSPTQTSDQPSSYTSNVTQTYLRIWFKEQFIR
jgi:hypothetical protein